MAAVARSQAGRLSISNEEQKEALTEQIMNAILDVSSGLRVYGFPLGML